jgi:hypothetical protein
MPIDEKLAREAKAIVALAFRNGPVEDVHASGRVTDDEMKAVMQHAVDWVALLLHLRERDDANYHRLVEWGSRYTGDWDDPVLPSLPTA